MKRWFCAIGFLLFATVAQAQSAPADIDAVMTRLEAEGYFETCRAGNAHACSYFVRLVVFTVNPHGNPNSYGALRKTAGGTNVDGYAEDAIALNAHPNDFHNVIDMVGGTGAPGARLQWGGPHPRRQTDVWEAPRPLSARELAVLRPGGGHPPTPTIPTPAPTPMPAPVNLQPILDRIAQLEALVRELHAKADTAAAQIQRSADSAQDAAAQARAAREAAEGAGQAAADVVMQIHAARQDVLVAIDLGKQIRDQSYRGRIPLGGGTVTLQPVRP